MLYDHAINVNIGGRGAHPVVALWCMDCLCSVGEFDQVNPLDELQAAINQHRAGPSKREQYAAPNP